ncbi:bifunctional 3'-5' exonuclease/DNA polymerase [Kamptonema sp. UHCC 0994]|uniref:bifunctional 3'-5' exonuclease/DNA polymerase n=1 Tax=Kamptonema sp. UHCC 0994 TaxID=3031329 RepID=UPI0023BA1707|nr:bifunctional 3'-5' exonuclease/DNA polymerase [Kamptonema sp. UHCC 0994]MDF0555898.1 bifunctional 3'-5' exonuclease/DNA polymerase [Kamptonema sp. UHCC 0994]
MKLNLVQTPYQLLNSGSELELALKPFQQASCFGIDCETAFGIDPYRAKVRLVQLAIPDRPVAIIDLFAIAPTDLGPLRSLLAGNALKIGHNLKFDWLMLTRAGLSPSKPFFDTYLAYRVLIAGLKRTSSLEAVADKLLKVKLDKAQQVSDWSGELSRTQLQYAATDAAILLPLCEVLHRQLYSAQLWQTAKLEFACLPAVASMELNGMLLDREQWGILGEKLATKRDSLLRQINSQLHRPNPHKQISLLPEFTDTINPRSPKQVLAALQEKGIPVTSTNSQQLIPLQGEYPVIQALLEYRSLSARINTFALGLPEHIHPITGRIHPNWFQIGARSGRFSCRKPNLTNIPRDKETRQCFKAAPGYVLLKADYSQIELRIMAKVSGDIRMVKAYSQGEDLHSLTASLVLGKLLAEITIEDRQLGKIINFGLIYGMGVRKFKLMAQAEHGVILTVEQASYFRKKFFESYTGIKQFHAKVRSAWSRGIRESRTVLGRRRLWSKETKPLLNEMLNNPIQGMSADITKLALALLFNPLSRTRARLICVVHDEILIECPLEKVSSVKAMLEKCMVRAGNKFLSPIPCQVEINVIESWGG